MLHYSVRRHNANTADYDEAFAISLQAFQVASFEEYIRNCPQLSGI